MIINPKTDPRYKEFQAEEIEKLRKEILGLSKEIQDLIQIGEDIIDRCIDRNKERNDGEKQDIIRGLNVFNLTENIPGDVMKYLAMLYTAGGYHNVRINCDCFSPFSSEDDPWHVKYPNQISFTLERGKW